MPIFANPAARKGVRGVFFAIALLLLSIVSTALDPATAKPTPQSGASITVSAAISLKDALDEMGKAYERSHPGFRITFNYAGSGTLQHQIEQGAPVDIFVSAGERQMDALQSEGLIIAETRRNLATNKLVLIVPSDSHDVQNFQDLARSSVKIIALGEPTTVPAGFYGRQTLEKLGLLAAVQKKFVYGKDVRQVLVFVETGNADAGLVYQTDARISSRVRVAAVAPDSSHDPIVYPAAVVKTTKRPDAAQAFLNFMVSPPARLVFEKYGFTSEKQAESH